MLDRHVEDGELQACAEYGMGFIAFTPLAQGMLTDKYLEQDRPAESRLGPQHWTSVPSGSPSDREI